MILYRGTPEPESVPALREYEVVFVSSDPYSAANYGDWVQAYDVGIPHLLKFETETGQRVIAQYLGRNAGASAQTELGIHPTEAWVSYLQSLGYDGYILNREIIGLFDRYLASHRIRMTKRERIEAR